MRIIWFLITLGLLTSHASAEDWTFRPLGSPSDLPKPGKAAPQQKLLRIESSRPNEVVDTEEWFARTGVALPTVPIDALPPAIPAAVGGRSLRTAIRNGDIFLLLYGDDYIAATRDDGRFLYGFDADTFLQPADDPEPYTEQPIVWAIESNGVLYLANSHRTYAKSSQGRNAYLTAVRIEDGELLWRSDPLVANTRNFLLHEGVLLSGYGFTSEPDYLYAIDPANGEILQQLKVKTGPDYLLFDDAGNLQVRTYNTDYVVEFTK